MKHHALTLAALTATVLSLPVNLPAVSAQAAGPRALLMSLTVAALWAAVALLCADRPGPVAATVACLSLLVVVLGAGLALYRLGLYPRGAEEALVLALMLAQAPFYGFRAISAGLPQALATGTLFCLAVMLLGGQLHRRARHRPQDNEVFGPAGPLPHEPLHPQVDRMSFRRAGRVRKRR